MIVEVTLGLFGGALVGLWATMWAVKTRVEGQTVAITSAVRVLEDLQDVAVELGGRDASGSAEAIVEVIEDTLGQMHVPTAADHALGIVSMLAQQFMASKLGPMAGMLPDSGEKAPGDLPETGGVYASNVE